MRFHFFTLCCFLLLTLFLRRSGAAPSSVNRRAISTPSTIDELNALKSIDESSDDLQYMLDEDDWTPYMSDDLYYYTNADVDVDGMMENESDDNRLDIEAVDDDDENQFSVAQPRFRGGFRGRGFGRGFGRFGRGRFGFGRGRFGRRFGRGFWGRRWPRWGRRWPRFGRRWWGGGWWRRPWWGWRRWPQPYPYPAYYPVPVPVPYGGYPYGGYGAEFSGEQLQNINLNLGMTDLDTGIGGVGGGEF